MSATPTPPGWYEDPYGEATWRWWDGDAWSTATRLDGRVAAASAAGTTTTMPAASPIGTPVAGEYPDAPDRQDRRRATIGLAVLALVALVIVASAILFTDSPNDLAVDDVPGADEQTPPTDGADEVPSDDPQESDPTTPSETPEDGSDEDGAGSEDEPPEDDAGAAEGSVELDFDGVCTVEVDAEEVDDPRPWDFDQCTSAPIALERGEERWIVVVASLSEGGYDEAAARDRAASEGFDGNLLWSSHYPSLNPDLWVVYDGPFADQEEARAAAEDVGGGSYPRILSDDDDDRYCVAADGCAGDEGDG